MYEHQLKTSYVISLTETAFLLFLNWVSWVQEWYLEKTFGGITAVFVRLFKKIYDFCVYDVSYVLLYDLQGRILYSLLDPFELVAYYAVSIKLFYIPAEYFIILFALAKPKIYCVLYIFAHTAVLLSECTHLYRLVYGTHSRFLQYQKVPGLCYEQVSVMHMLADVFLMSDSLMLICLYGSPWGFVEAFICCANIAVLILNILLSQDQEQFSDFEPELALEYLELDGRISPKVLQTLRNQVPTEPAFEL